MSGENDCAVVRWLRTGPVAATLMLALLLSAAGSGTSEAATKKQCEAAHKAGMNRCSDLAEPDQCYGQVWRQYNKCRCGAAGGVYSEHLGTPHCTGGTESYSVSPPPNVPRRPKGPQQVAPQPLSHPPPKPKGPGSVGTPPKSNPTTPVKPRGPGSVGAPPKSNSSSDGGTILRSGKSGDSNSRGGGRSGGSLR